MKNKEIIFIVVFIITVFSLACDNASSNTNTKASPTPTPTEEQKKEEADRIEGEKLKAIGDYVTKSHKGWVLSGLSGGPDDAKCAVDVPCYLHLIQKDQNKVVAVVLRQFQKADGTTYWFVYAATPVDLARTRISQIKEKEHEETLSNLTIDDCQTVIDEMADASDMDDRGDYDNGY